MAHHFSDDLLIDSGRKYPCHQDVDEDTSLFLNRFADTYQRLVGGALSWDNIILTGGGGALLHSKLIPILKHGNVILADIKENLHLANVRGGFRPNSPATAFNRAVSLVWLGLFRTAMVKLLSPKRSRSLFRMVVFPVPTSP